MANLDETHIPKVKKQLKPAEEMVEEESFSYAVQIVNSSVFCMATQSAIELGIFEVMAKAGPDAKLSAKDIASQLSCKNPEAASMIDRVLRLLACHSVVYCSAVAADEQKLGSFQRLYSMAPVAKYFVRNADGVSLGPLMGLLQDKVFLDSWLVSVLLIPS